MKDKKAFTLAETLIVLVILGVIASITIPAVVRRQVEAQNRTRIKKAMTVYDTAINKMVVENGIKSNDALINEFNADKNNNSCAKSRAYFKVSQEGANDCIFKASDGIWWNISDINHPIIAFNEDDLTDEIASGDTNKAFKLVGYLDDNNGSLRVGDLAVAEGDNKTYLNKLYGFINNVTTNNQPTENEPTENSIACPVHAVFDKTTNVCGCPSGYVLFCCGNRCMCTSQDLLSTCDCRKPEIFCHIPMHSGGSND